MKNRAFGIDIGATAIKVVWLSHQQEVFSLNAAFSCPTPAKGMFSESPLDQEEVAQVLRKVISDAKISTPYANIALPENQVYTKVIEMPALSDKELSSAIVYEAEQYIPVALENITFDYKVLSRPPSQQAGTMDVLLVGAPKTMIEKYKRILSLAGITPVSAETEILALVRALVGKNFPNSIIINLGAVATSICIVKDGGIVFTYAIPTGGNALTRSIAADFGFTFPQAEEYKKTYGISQKNMGGKIGQSTLPILNSILSEVKKAQAHYTEKYKNQSPIQQLVLCGGTAKLPGLDIFFTENSGFETVISNPWNILSHQQMPKEIVDSAPDYTIAVGLAMRDYE